MHRAEVCFCLALMGISHVALGKAFDFHISIFSSVKYDHSYSLSEDDREHKFEIERVFERKAAL